MEGDGRKSAVGISLAFLWKKVWAIRVRYLMGKTDFYQICGMRLLF
jgi:hypothetical protein